MLAKLDARVLFAPGDPDGEGCCCDYHDDGAAGGSGVRVIVDDKPVQGEIAYVMNGFPRLSETFITNEIHLLEQQGLTLRLYSVKREDEPKVHGVVARIKASLTHLPRASSLSGSTLPGWLWRNLPAFLQSHRLLMLRHPARYLATLLSALLMCWRYRSGPLKLRKVFIKEFLQAGFIAADLLEHQAVAHLHGHFCHGVATITWFASRLTGLPFSFTAHAKDIYQADLNPGDLLPRKLAAARFVVTCTEANARHLKARYPEAAGVRTIYHGLDTDYFLPAGGDDHRLPLILSVGRFVAKKGFTYLIEACALLKSEGLDFACLIVGERGDAEPEMKTLIERHGLQEEVRLMGAVTQEQLRRVYRSARVFALPCQVMDDGDRDGIPNVLAEAMASGVPVVATRISGIPELIVDEECGLLIESRNAAALAHAIRRLFVDAALRERISAAGRERICECFDSHRTTMELRSLFLESLREVA